MKFYTKDQLKSSRIFFDKNPPRFGIYLTLFTALVLIGALITSNYVMKPYIVQAQGIVTTSDNEYVSSNVNGTIVDIIFKEGSTVNKGDILFKVSNGQESSQLDPLSKQLEQAQAKIEIMDRYQKSLETKKNMMKNSGLEQEYFGYVEYYLSQVKSEDHSNNSQDRTLQEKQDKLLTLETTIESLKNDISKITISDVSERGLSKIMSERDKLSEEVTTLLQEKELNTSSEEITNITKKIENLQAKIVAYDNEIESYQDKLDDMQVNEAKKQELQSQLQSKESERDSLVEEIKSLKEQSASPVGQAEQMKAQLLAELGKNRTATQAQILELEGNIKVISNQIDTYSVVAPQDGIVHYVSPIHVGMAVQQNQVVAEVSLNTAESLIVEAYVNAADISKIHIGDTVNVAIVGVNTTKYGTVKGTLVSIDSGTISQETSNGNVLLYRVQIKLDKYSISHKTETIDLIKSMPIQARIVYEKESYLDWILNMLSFKN